MINNPREARALITRAHGLLGGLLAAVWLLGCQEARPNDDAYQGVAELDERVLAFELPGRIADVSVERGQVLEASAVLATLDDALDRVAGGARAAEVRAAEAQLDLLRAGARREEVRATRAELEAASATAHLVAQNLARQRRLLASGAATQASVDQLDAELTRASAHREAIQNQLGALRSGARAQELLAAEARVDAARAALAAIEERLSRHRLSTPIAGVVQDIHVEPGEVVAPGAPAITVVEPSRPYADVFVPQGEIDRVWVGRRVSVRSDALDAPLPGTVEHISARTEFTPRFLFSEQERPNLVIRVRVRIEDSERRLRAGVPTFVSLDAGAPPTEHVATTREAL